MSNNLVQLGTIISSFLNYDQLNDSLGEPRGCHQNSTYVPCDGRTINGSKLANVTDRNQVPDLRGQFIRGMNSFHLEGQPEIDPSKSDPDGLNRKVGDYQGDEFKSHIHSENAPNVGGNGSWSFPDGQAWTSQGQRGFGATTDPTGGHETRPKNVSVNFYIKIN